MISEISDKFNNIVVSTGASYDEEIQLTAKILKNPVEMERKINNGTKHIMEDIEKISVVVDDLDNGLQLQSTSD